MLGRARAMPPATGRDAVGSGKGSDGALPGDGRLRAHMTTEVAIQRQGNNLSGEDRERLRV
jgi:hypothetical protein